MAIHFYPKVGGHVDFDTPEEAARFFEITGGGTREAPKPEAGTVLAVAPATLPKSTVKKKTPGLSRKTQRLEDSIQMVMGGSELSSHEILEKLKENGWGPESSDQLSYIRYTLSSNSAIFLRASRGRYHLDPENPYTVGVHTHPIEGHVNPKSKKTTKAAPVEKLSEKPKEKPVAAVVIEPPEVEGDPEALVAQLSASEPEVIEPPEPEVIEPPEPEVALTQLQEPDPVPTPVVEAPVVAAPIETPVDDTEDPVVNILREFESELGSI